ncbi:hypothetical protein [Xanthomonas albilineans]|uniref:Uncharacterized protein n=3 Tax=Xanthomonas albilineans TaxID=29447 RepID=D2UG40_XANAP|nr:hypothetical protein [Xanthomonas albilineans]QHQ29603.1 hypothetical protein XaFJ1_GM002891 [Xanthomonas albilineans]CBA17351.1 hypothetical protein XALC_2874 [Xanthomonas albilineans GPE PC73]
MLALADGRGIALAWQVPALPAVPATAIAMVEDTTECTTPRVLLAAASLARKGAFELREALRGLPLQLLLPPGAQETMDFWSGFDVRRVASMAAGVHAATIVVLPAWIEQQPRGLLLALVADKPVVATAAGGLGTDAGLWRCVEASDYAALRVQLLLALQGGS